MQELKHTQIHLWLKQKNFQKKIERLKKFLFGIARSIIEFIWVPENYKDPVLGSPFWKGMENVGNINVNVQ